MNKRKPVEDSVRLKVDGVIAYLKNENLAHLISISKVCELSKINRANLYAHYPDLIRVIKSEKTQKTSSARGAAVSVDLLIEIADLKKRLHATTYVCIELQMALQIAKDQIEHLKRIKSNRR